MLADELDFVIGVDTHRNEHAFALIACPRGAPLLEGLIAADEQGYAAALALACEHAPGRRAWAIEGTGCYGKGPARSLARQGERVLEVERPKRQGGRGRAKSDRLDAYARPARCWPRSGRRCLVRPAHVSPCACCWRQDERGRSAQGGAYAARHLFRLLEASAATASH